MPPLNLMHIVKGAGSSQSPTSFLHLTRQTSKYIYWILLSSPYLIKYKVERNQNVSKWGLDGKRKLCSHIRLKKHAEIKQNLFRSRMSMIIKCHSYDLIKNCDIWSFKIIFACIITYFCFMLQLFYSALIICVCLTDYSPLVFEFNHVSKWNGWGTLFLISSILVSL